MPADGQHGDKARLVTEVLWYAAFVLIVTHHLVGDSGVNRIAGDLGVVMFVVLTGVTVSTRLPSHSLRRRQVVAAAALVFGVGLALSQLGTTVAVLLPALSLLGLIAYACRRLPDRALWPAAVAGALVLPYLAQRWRPEIDGSLAGPTLRTALTAPVRTLHELLAGTYYPLLAMLPLALFGLILGRWLHRPAAQRVVLLARCAALLPVAVGLVLLPSWITIAGVNPYPPSVRDHVPVRGEQVLAQFSNYPFAATTARLCTAAVIVAVIALAVAAWFPRSEQWVRWSRIGNYALVGYVLHVLILFLFPIQENPLPAIGQLAGHLSGVTALFAMRIRAQELLAEQEDSERVGTG